MSWLERLKNKKRPDTLPTKPTKPPFVGFVGTHLGHFQKLQSANGDAGGDLATTPEVQTRQPDPVVVPDPAEALNRPMSYLLAPDHLIEGLCLMTQDDLADIRTGRLPLESARLYLQNHERDHPHLAERLKCARMAATEPDKMPDTRHPLDVAIERLRLDGLEVHPDDAKFIRARIGTRANWRDLLNRYLETWLLAAATEPAPHRRQNAGRRQANQWLLGGTR